MEKGIIGVVMSFEQEYTVFLQRKIEFRQKKATEDKTANFSDSLSTRPLKVECFIEIAKAIKTLRVITDFKKSTNEQENVLRVLAPIKRSV